MVDWYHPDDLPPVACAVRLWWTANGVPRLVDHAVRQRDRQRKKTVVWDWYSVDTVTRRLNVLSAGSPICWQPRDDRWTWPGGTVPTPLQPHQIPRLANHRYLSAEMEALELAEMQRETEAERHFANQEGHRARVREDGMPWWWDVADVRYEPPGEVSRVMCEGRVMRALNAAGGWRPRLKIKTLSMLIAALADEVALNASEIAERELTRFRALGPDEHDFMEAMRWITALSRPTVHDPLVRIERAWKPSREQLVLNYRARFRTMTWADIAAALNPSKPISYQRVQQIYEQAINHCWHIANAPVEVDPRMTALREANREHRRRETQV